MGMTQRMKSYSLKACFTDDLGKGMGDRVGQKGRAIEL